MPPLAFQQDLPQGLGSLEADSLKTTFSADDKKQCTFTYPKTTPSHPQSRSLHLHLGIKHPTSQIPTHAHNKVKSKITGHIPSPKTDLPIQARFPSLTAHTLDDMHVSCRSRR